MLGCLSDFIIFSAILDNELSLIYDIREEPQFWYYYDALMYRKELTEIICPIKFCKCRDASVSLWSWVQF